MIIAGIVTHEPRLKELSQAIFSVKGQVDEIVIVDNGSKTSSKLSWERLKEYGAKIHVIQNRKNMGVARALNQIFFYAKNISAEWVLTMDQDSVCKADMIECMKKDIKMNTGIVGPNVIYKGNESYCIKSRNCVEEVEWVITSGAFTSVKAWEMAGGFDEWMFIDGVDKDFCIRLKRAGYVVLRDWRVCIWHELGQLKCKKFLGRIIYVTNHPPKRYYYMARNAIYLDHKLGRRDGKEQVLKMILKILLYEEKKYAKIKAIGLGITTQRKILGFVKN